MDALLPAAEPLIELAIAEDIGPGDATSESTLDASVTLCGRIVAKTPGVIAGLSVAAAVFQRVDPDVTFVAHVRAATAGRVDEVNTHPFAMARDGLLPRPLEAGEVEGLRLGELLVLDVVAGRKQRLSKELE